MNERNLSRDVHVRWTPLVLLLCVLASACGSGRGPDVTSVGAPAPRDPMRFEAVPDFTFDDSRGGQLSKEDLSGTPWIGVPFFLECTGPCPSITRDIRERLYPELEGTGVRLVSFSLDPERDTPEALDAYAAHPRHQEAGAILTSLCFNGADGIIVFDLDVGGDDTEILVEG